MPVLKHVEMGYNRLTSVSSDEHRGSMEYSLEIMNLDNNRLDDWLQIVDALKPMTR